MNNNNFFDTLIKIVMIVVAIVVALWFVFNVIIPVVSFAITTALVVGVVGLLVWIVYKVLTTDPDAVT